MLTSPGKGVETWGGTNQNQKYEWSKYCEEGVLALWFYHLALVIVQLRNKTISRLCVYIQLLELSKEPCFWDNISTSKFI